MKTIVILFFNTAESFTTTNERAYLVFEEEKHMRSSFCLYSDGNFYETKGAGCYEQAFAWGHWQKLNDTIVLSYKRGNVFDYDIINSSTTSAKYQVIRIIDLYGQPVRSQHIYDQSSFHDLKSTATLKTRKGKRFQYMAPDFWNAKRNDSLFSSNADTITYQWKCNRESIESNDSGAPLLNQEIKTAKVLIEGKKRINK